MRIVDEVIDFEAWTVINKGTDQSKPVVKLEDISTAVLPREKMNHALLYIIHILLRKANFFMFFSLCKNYRNASGC